MSLLAGTELVLVAQVPKAGDRWHQVHFNIDVASRFLRVTPGGDLMVSLERVDWAGRVVARSARPLVFAERNRNCKVEFDFGGVVDYPSGGPPLLVVLELDVRQFRYLSLLPGSSGYDEMLRLTNDLPSVGRGKRRAITTLDEVRLRWPACPL
jgi:hypothetical protein